ncbi:MAG TPA: extracellular solute-binding protein [Phototrophicaceae bacterium]|nr:extracellular solute-binding protein [Phototrophicaceae bacterium]
MKVHKGFLSLSVLLGLLLAVAVPAASAQDASTLTVWITWGDNPAQLQDLFNEYGSAHGITVQVNAPVDADKVVAGLSSNEPPDILITGGPSDTGSWAREELISPLDDLMKSSGIDTATMTTAPLGQCVYGGQYYCLPWGTDTYALFWNKDLFEDAGLDPETPPQTLEELVADADKLTKVEADGTVSQVGFVPDFSWSHLNFYVRMFGGYWYSDDGKKLTFTSQPMVDALKWEQQFYSKYGADQVLRFTSAMGAYQSPDQGFYAGKIAMMLDGEWQTGPNFISLYKPELYYGVAPFPYPADHPERKNTNLLEGTVAMIPSGSPNQAAAADLLAWMESPQVVADEMYANFNLPTTTAAASDPRFTENDNFDVFLKLMNDPNATTGIYSAIDSEVTTSIGQIEEQVLHAGADPLPLLQEAQDQLQPKLDASLK